MIFSHFVIFRLNLSYSVRNHSRVVIVDIIYRSAVSFKSVCQPEAFAKTICNSLIHFGVDSDTFVLYNIVA